MARESVHRRLFRALLRLFPAEFRGDFGEQMTADFDDQCLDAVGRSGGVRRLWLRTALDLLVRAPREHLDLLWRDVVYALRSLRRHPASTAMAVLSLAIGIGLNSAVFSVVRGVLWQPLPFPESDRLVEVGVIPSGDVVPTRVPLDLYRDLIEHTQSLEHLGAVESRNVVIVEPGEPRFATCPRITPNLFGMLGVSPILGRTFTDLEYAQALSDRAGAIQTPSPRVLILSHAEWQQHFLADLTVVGRRVGLSGGGSAEVVGVMGPELETLPGTPLGSRCWTPGDLGPAQAEPWSERGTLRAFGRLAPSISTAQALAEVRAEHEDSGSLGVVTLRDRVVGRARTQLILLFGAVVFVLLVTCANVANLLFARAMGRRDELAVRVALGATRIRLLRQSLTESLLVAALGGAAGFVLALLAVPVLISWAPPGIRDRHGGHLVFDVGPHGYLNGGHAHADALAITLTVAGRPLLVDPGTATYTMDPRLRDRFRRSASHNTVTIDGRSAAEPAGPFHWASRADARLDAWRGTPRFAWAEGAHDGYAPIRHRRSGLELVDATYAAAAHDRGLGVVAGEWLPDLHASIGGDRLDLWTSAPPSSLELSGAALADVRHVRMNGRAVRVTSAGPGVLVVTDRPRDEAAVLAACGAL